jgi:hypothetical protein
MIENVKKIINCKICFQALEEPVSLPCGETCCKKHQTAFMFGKLCTLCDQLHPLKLGESFPVNKLAQDLISNKFTELDFGEDYKQAKQKLSELNQKFQEYTNLKSNPQDFIHEFFSNLRNKVDLERETLIQKINECSEKLLAEIDSYQNECMTKLSSSKAKEPLCVNLAVIKSDLEKWEQELSYLKVDQKLWDSIKQMHVKHWTALESAKFSHENELIKCRLEKFQIEMKFSDMLSLFGRSVGFER